MAKSVLLSSYVAIASNALADWCNKIELKAECEEQDATVFASGGWNERLAGIKSFELGLGLKQDVAASALDSIMWPLAFTVVTFEVRLSQAAVGTSNPKYTGSLLIKEWVPIAGSVGDIAEMDLTFPGTGALTRATA